MSESTKEYSVLYAEIETAGEVARRIVTGPHRPKLPKLYGNERLALAARARETARWFAHLAEVLELER